MMYSIDGTSVVALGIVRSFPFGRSSADPQTRAAASAFHFQLQPPTPIPTRLRPGPTQHLWPRKNSLRDIFTPSRPTMVSPKACDGLRRTNTNNLSPQLRSMRSPSPAPRGHTYSQAPRTAQFTCRAQFLAMPKTQRPR